MPVIGFACVSFLAVKGVNFGILLKVTPLTCKFGHHVVTSLCGYKPRKELEDEVVQARALFG